MRFMNGQPLESLGNPMEDNPYLEVDSMLTDLESKLRGETDIDGKEPIEEPDISIEAK